MIRRFFTVELDLRALAGLRVALGSLVLVDLLLRLRDLSAFYTDRGVLPRELLLEFPHPTLFQFFLTVGTPVGALLWFGLLGACALGLLLGWRTSWCALGTWVLHIALKHRNPLVLDAGDLELGLMLWWAIFLPLGARYSIDARRHPEWAELPNSYSSVATTGYLFQLSLMYGFAALNKTDPVWWDSGLALYYFLHQDQFLTSLGRDLSPFGAQLRGLTYTVLALEGLIALLPWVPYKRKAFRYTACVLLVALHLGIGLTAELGMMVPINIAFSIALWPGAWVEKLLRGVVWPKLPSMGKRLPQGYAWPRAVQVFLVLICVYTAHLNVAIHRGWVVPYPVKFFGYLFRQQQDWMMFAPHPGVQDGWLVAEARTLTGEEVDLLRDGRPVDLKKPVSVAALNKNHRWRLWHLNLVEREDPRVYRSYCRWLAERWNEENRGPKAVTQVTLVFVSEPTPPPGAELRSQPITLLEYQVPESSYRRPNEVYLPLSLPSKP